MKFARPFLPTYRLRARPHLLIQIINKDTFTYERTLIYLHAAHSRPHYCLFFSGRTHIANPIYQPWQCYLSATTKSVVFILHYPCNSSTPTPMYSATQTPSLSTVLFYNLYLYSLQLLSATRPLSSVTILICNPSRFISYNLTFNCNLIRCRPCSILQSTPACQSHSSYHFQSTLSYQLRFLSYL